MSTHKCEQCDKIGFELTEDPCSSCFQVEEHINITDVVNSPAHYKVGGIETIDFIEAKGLGYNLGNAVKYISRAGYKLDRLEDLKKAQWYLAREIGAIK
jgi:hypothetical protein